MTQAVEAVLDGFDTDRDIEVNALLCAMRQSDRGPEVADLVIAFRDDGWSAWTSPDRGRVPASLFADPFATLRAAMCRYTIHAGEAAGVASIADALATCMPERLGHGVRIIEDIRVEGTPRRSVTSPPTCATARSHWRSVPPRTCRPGSRTPSQSIR